jgi:hypothetical protein
MLPPFIIDQIRKREQEERARHDEEQPRLELPLPRPRLPGGAGERAETPSDAPPAPGEERGVIILELL